MLTIGQNEWRRTPPAEPMKTLSTAIKPYFSVLAFAFPIALGAALLYWAATHRAQPEKLPEQELARTLRIIEVQPTTIVPKAIGFGESAPSKSFQAVAEVKGKIVQLHSDLKPGNFVREGELLVAIDETDVAITIGRLQAEIARSEASIHELTATQQNLESGLAIEQSSWELANRELERLQRLNQQGRAIADSEVDAQRRSVLAQQQSVQNLQNSLNLLPAQIQSAEASMAVSKANLASSERDLERCRVVAPFDCRLGEVDLDLDEVVSVGQVLLTVQAIDKLEIEAQFGIDKLASLIHPDRPSPNLLRDLTADPQELVRSFFDVDVTLRYGPGDLRSTRDANFERLRETLDPQARTVGLVVSVDQPFQREGKARDAGPPPLPGTYCEVELRGVPLKDAFVVPRAAVHRDASEDRDTRGRSGVVFLVDDESRLRKRHVTILLQHQNAAAVQGLNSGDRVAVSDPTPAIEGMLVDPRLDEALSKALHAAAGDEE